MLINEVSNGTIVTIHVEDSYGREASFESTVITCSQKFVNKLTDIAEQMGTKSFIPIELVTEKEKSINFQSSGIKCSITALINEKPYTWKQVRIFKFSLTEKEEVHVAFTSDDPESVNKRNEYRLWLGYDAIFKFGDSRVLHDCLLKDISEHGYALITEDYDIKIGDSIEVQFYEESKKSDDTVSTLYKFKGSVARKLQLGNGCILIGCYTDAGNKEVSRFIYQKQRERVSLSGKNGNKRTETLNQMMDRISSKSD